jgi:hypothetical protein
MRQNRTGCAKHLQRFDVFNGAARGGLLIRHEARHLHTHIKDGLVEAKVGRNDKRERNLFLTDEGATLERKLSDAQRARMRRAFRDAGPDAVSGFRQVLEAMMDSDQRRRYQTLREGHK